MFSTFSLLGRTTGRRSKQESHTTHTHIITNEEEL